MFGHAMKIKNNGMEVVLKMPKKEDMGIVSEGFNSLNVVQYTAQTAAQPIENEFEWYEKNRKDPDTRTWGIFVDEKFVGVTGLHHIDQFAHSCTSGIVIFSREYWGKGVASGAHLMRTLYAADQLNRYTIISKVRTVNEASCRALQRVGYSITGKELRSGFRNGRYLDSWVLSWINPNPSIVALLYPEGLPDECKESVEKAQLALEKARKEVEYL